MEFFDKLEMAINSVVMGPLSHILEKGGSLAETAQPISPIIFSCLGDIVAFSECAKESTFKITWANLDLAVSILMLADPFWRMGSKGI